MLSRASNNLHLPPVIISLASSFGGCVFTPSLSFSQHPRFSPSVYSSFSTSSTISNPSGFFPTNSSAPNSSLFSFSNCFGFMGRPSFQGKASFTTDSSLGESREILVQHLLVKENDLKLLTELQKRVAGGEDLSDLAVEYSSCPSKEEGGMLGWVKRGEMVPEFEEAAFSAPLNTVVKCKTKFGWHLLQVLSEREELKIQEIQTDELHEKLKDPNFIEEAQLIDVREPDEIAKASLPGFRAYPLQQFGSWAPEFTSKFDPNEDIYVLCYRGIRSMEVAKWLQSQGFKKVFNVAGGINAYARNTDPSVPTYTK